MTNKKQSSQSDDDRPPILGQWRNLYWMVLILHLFIIIAFYLFTRYYS